MKGSYCQDHQARATNWRPDVERGNTTERGYGARWRKIRAQALDRDQRLCQPCLAVGRITRGTEVDHVTPKSAGGTDHLDNLQTICRNCHRAKTALDSTATGGGVRKNRRPHE